MNESASWPYNLLSRDPPPLFTANTIKGMRTVIKAKLM